MLIKSIQKFVCISLLLIVGGLTMNFGFAEPAYAGELAHHFTVSVWVKPETGSTASKALAVKDEEIRIVTNASSQPVCQIYASSAWQTGATSSTALSAGTWQYVTCTYDKANIYVFVDGVQVGSQAQTSTVNDASTNWRMGSDEGATYGDFNGTVDDIKIYDYARTPQQIVSDMNAGHPAPGSPVGSAYVHYKFDEGYGTTAYNGGNGGNTLDATITSGTWTNSGKLGKAITFSTSTSVADTITDPGYNNTLSLWVYPTTSVASKTLATSGKLTTDASSRPVYGGCTGTALSLNTWTHIVAVSNGSTSCAIYQDGKLTSSGATGVTFGISLNIGGTSFTGTIDEFKLYTLAMTADQVKTEFNQGFASVWGASSTSSDGTASYSTTDEYCPPGQTTACVAPVGEWKMDENTGTGTNAIKDTSGNNFHGTTYGSISNSNWIPGKYGSALYFSGDGNNDAVIVPHNTTLNPTNITFSAWYKVTYIAPNASKGVISKSDTGSSNISYRMPIYADLSGNLRVDCTISTDGTTGQSAQYASILPNVWYHQTCTYDGETVSLYLNGQLMHQNTTPSGNIYSGTSDLKIAKLDYNNFYFNGFIDEVKIYNYARTLEQVAWDYNHGASIGHWKFDECEGDTAYDSMGSYNGTISSGGSGDNSVVGTCSGGTGMRGSAATGKINSALDFDGANDYVNLGTNFNFTSSFSVGAWVYFKDPSTRTDHIVNKNGTTNQRNWSLYNDYGAIAFYLPTASSGTPACTVYQNGGVQQNEWTHVVGMYDSTAQRIRIYINGNLSSEKSCPYSSISAYNNSVWIGARQSNSSYSYTKIDDVKIYNYSLTAQQIRNEYTGGALKFGP